MHGVQPPRPWEPKNRPRPSARRKGLSCCSPSVRYLPKPKARARCNCHEQYTCCKLALFPPAAFLLLLLPLPTWSLRMSRQMAPLWLLMLGCQTWGKRSREAQQSHSLHLPHLHDLLAGAAATRASRRQQQIHSPNLGTKVMIDNWYGSW